MGKNWKVGVCGLFTKEVILGTGLSQQRVFICRLVTVLGVCDPSVALSLIQGELLSNTKKHILDRHTSVNKNSQPEAELQKPKIKVGIFEYFPRIMNFDGLGLCFIFCR